MVVPCEREIRLGDARHRVPAAYFGAWRFSWLVVAGILMPTQPTIVALDMNKLEDVLRRAETNELTDEDCATIRMLFVSYVHLLDMLKNTKTSMDRLRKLLFGVSTEKLAAVRGARKDSQPPAVEASAADGEIVHNDDTTVKILEWMGERARQAALKDDGSAESAEDATGDAKAKRRGMFTTGIVSLRGDRKIALFLSGRRHAGENLKDVLLRRARELPPPIQMCDALSRNLPGELQTILGNCLAHGRRQFVDVADWFPEECGHVLESLAAVYHNDTLAREQNLSPHERLEFHQRESGPVMEELHIWLARQFQHRAVEPNSALGGAISYLLKHWEKLTLFLRVAGAPLDNNIVEQALKK